jgi:hypothetical protein
MLEPSLSVRLYQHILRGKLLPPRPPNNRLGDQNVLFGGERGRERMGFPWAHGQITRESPAGTGEIPECALALEWSRVVCDEALDGEATEGTN